MNNQIELIIEELNLSKGDIVYYCSFHHILTLKEKLIDLFFGGFYQIYKDNDYSSLRYIVKKSKENFAEIYKISDKQKMELIKVVDNWDENTKYPFKTLKVEDIKYRCLRKEIVG